MDFIWKTDVIRILLSITLIALASSVLFTIFVPYCQHQLNLSVSHSYQLFGTWLSILFVAPILSGYVTQTYLTYYTAVLWGIMLLIVAELLFAIGSRFTFYSGLIIYPLGTSFFYANTFAMFSRIFPENNKTRTSAFIFIYLAMNVGAFIGGLCSQPIINHYGYSAFFVFSVILAIVAFFIMAYRHLGDQKLIVYHYNLPIYIVLFISIFGLLLKYQFEIHVLTFVFYLIGIGYLWSRTRNHSRQDRQSAVWFVMFSIFLISYWSFYMLYPSVVEVFMEKTLTLRIWGQPIQPTAIASLSPFFLIIFGLLLAKFKPHRDSATMIKNKIVSGLIFLAAGFLCLFFWQYTSHYGQLCLAVLIIISYFFYALSEILVGPIVFSMVGLFTREELLGTMMGFIYLIHSLSGGVTAWLSSYSAKNSNNPTIFLPYAVIAFIVAMIVMAICSIRQPVQR